MAELLSQVELHIGGATVEHTAVGMMPTGVQRRIGRTEQSIDSSLSYLILKVSTSLLQDKYALLYLFGNIGAFAIHNGIDVAHVEDLSEMIFDAEPFFTEAMRVSIINESSDVPWYASSEMLRRYLFGCVQAQNENLLERLPAIDDQVEMYNAFFPSEVAD